MSFSESSTIQQAVVDRLTQSDLGWTYTPGKDLPRTTDGVLIEEHLVDALIDLNPALDDDPHRVDEILPKLRATILSATQDGLLKANEKMTSWLRGHETIKYLDADDYVPVRLIDFEHPERNTLIVSDEVTFGAQAQSRRFDLVLWVNGIPLVVGETKSPVDSSVSWLNGADDIHTTYERECAPFFVANVLSFATEGRELHYGAVGQPPEMWLQWGSTTDPLDLPDGKRVLRAVELLLRPERILGILRDFTLYDRPTIDGRLRMVKLIPRYPQVEGVEAIHRRVLSPDRNQGLIWHHQGTGKTLLQAFAALKLLNDDRVGGPTVMIVVDRVDLAEQTYRQLATAGMPRLKVAGSKQDLQRLLADDTRGVIVTTIFKFEAAGFLNDRSNIVVLIDEAHRTQEGTLGHDLREALPNAQFFGLTGTPIADNERNTFKLFGDSDDPGWVLNHYSVERSIADGASVPIHVETRLVDFHVDKQRLDQAYKALADEEGLTDEEREVLAEKASSVKTFMLNPDRIRAVCEDVVDHYLAKVHPLGQKAQVVAYDRELCARYQEEIDRILAERGVDLETAVVMTVGTVKSEPPEWRERYELSKDQEAKVKARFGDHADPLSLLIVTAKLLTGFDAPIEGCLYLDKPLRLHTLFQAICRTNRRWTNPANGQEKLYGLVVDYVGLGDQIAKALKAADPDKGGKRPVDVDELAEEFVAAMDAALDRFAGIDRTAADYATLMEAQERLVTQDQKDGFARDFITVQGLWEFLDPNAALEPHRDDYRWLGKVYESVKPTGVLDKLLWARLGAKTLALVHGHITDVEVTGTGLDEVIVDAETIEAIRQLALPGTAVGGLADPITVGEALDTIEARIRRAIDRSGGHHVYQELSERLDRLRQAQVGRAEASVEFLKQLLELGQRVRAAEKIEDEEGLEALDLLPDPKVGALTQILREYAPESTPQIIRTVAADIDAIFLQVTDTNWRQSQPGDREVRREIRRALNRNGLPEAGELFDRAYAYVRENY